MKRNTRMIVTALTILGLSAGGFAHAARGDGTCDGPYAMSGKHGEYIGKRLDRLHADLKLTPEQDAAWQSWRSETRESMAKLGKQRPDFKALAQLPAPERMAKMLEMKKEQHKKMEDSLASLRAFYAKLTPEQQKTFDAFNPFSDSRRDGSRRGEGKGSGGK
ncbi:MAG: Spy/CpxP family protein refolding chaperone [Azospira sp.]|jgi:Spy/CpxP family protein refolding chaperone|nr:Spy/CpxP family protein refolding chaperone [Azospira sp.]